MRESPATQRPAADVVLPLDSAQRCNKALKPGQWLMKPDAQYGGLIGEGAPLTLCGRDVALHVVISGLLAQHSATLVAAPELDTLYSGWVTGVSLESLLRSLLTGYDLEFRYFWDGDSHRLAALRVAERLEGDDAAEHVGFERPDNAPFQAQRFHSDYPELESALLSSDYQTRMEALDDWVAEGEGLDVLDRALRNETDADLRILMLEKLDESGSVVALQSILRHLEDPSPDVAVVAIGLMADWHDEELVRRHVALLVAHESAAVREAAQDAIDRFR